MNNSSRSAVVPILVTFLVTAGVLSAVWYFLLRPRDGYADGKSYAYKYGSKLGKEEMSYRKFQQVYLDETNVPKDSRGDVAEGMDTWHWWTGGNQDFWRKVAKKTSGLPITVDFLALLHQVPRKDRFGLLGTINDPDCEAATEPDDYGLMIDRMKEGTADWKIEDYGWSSGIVGLRLYENKRFDPKKWSLARYLRDPGHVEPPYIVGMACAFCHVAFNPTRPPADIANPKWENLAAVIGNQYLSEGSLFARDAGPDQFAWHYLHTQPPGTSETSRLDTDFINNPTVINSIYHLKQRLDLKREERITPEQKKILQALFKNINQDGVNLDLGGNDAEPTQKTPHVLLDGADSMGVPIASLRVWVNIGMHHEQWMESWAVNPENLRESLKRNFNQTPFSILEAQKDLSSYWVKSEKRMGKLEKFALSAPPYPLAKAPDGDKYLSKDKEQLRKGKIAFADHCARCHNSKPLPANLPKDPDALKKVWRDLVLADNFLEDNYLSDDVRHPLTEIKTNAARALATNALKGHIWDNFSSVSYKEQSGARGQLQDEDEKGNPRDLYNPLTGRYDIKLVVPDTQVASYRTPSLVSIWATAPYLHNNSVGIFTKDPSTAGRMAAFEDGIRKLLWPEKRLGIKSIKVTTQDSRLPDLFDVIRSEAQAAGLPPLLPPTVTSELLRVPKGTPVNLVMNVHFKDLRAVLKAYVDGCLQGEPAERFVPLHLHNHQAGQQSMARKMLELSTCPDFIEDRGHTFGRELSDDQKEALIEFIKTF